MKTFAILIMLLVALVGGILFKMLTAPLEIGPSKMVGADRPNKPPSAVAEARTGAGSLDEFFASRSGRELVRHPSLINDGHFMADHPDVARYLGEYPQLRDELAHEAPSDFVPKSVASAASISTSTKTAVSPSVDKASVDAAPIPSAPREKESPSDIGSLSDFLHRYPEVAEDLRKDPSLANNYEYLEAHPTLVRYLGDHPEAEAQLRRVSRRHSDFEDSVTVTPSPERRPAADWIRSDDGYDSDYDRRIRTGHFEEYPPRAVGRAPMRMPDDSDDDD